MTRKRNRYEGLNKAQKGGDSVLEMSPAEWKKYFLTANHRTMRKIHGQICRMPKDDHWERVKEIYVTSLLERQEKTDL